MRSRHIYLVTFQKLKYVSNASNKNSAYLTLKRDCEKRAAPSLHIRNNEIMYIALKVTVAAVNADDDRVNFNFVGESISESWCIGPRKGSDISNPSISQHITIHGNWINDASGSRIFFHATHIE